jgi:hypothetical protein
MSLETLGGQPVKLTAEIGGRQSVGLYMAMYMRDRKTPLSLAVYQGGLFMIGAPVKIFLSVILNLNIPIITGLWVSNNQKRIKMDNEKLERANLLTERIKALKSQLEKVEEIRARGERNPDKCAVRAYGENKMIDHDLFEIALFSQEKRIQIKLAEVEKEFSAL